MSMHQSRLAPSRVIAAALAIGAASLIADVALAAANVKVVSKTVNYSDLDLTRASDAQRLYARLKRASKEVCGAHEERGVVMQRRYDACIDEALTQAVEDVNAPTLTALHAAVPRIRVARKD